jgi:membrane protein
LKLEQAKTRYLEFYNSLMARKPVKFLKRVIQEFLTDNCPLLAAAISFNLLLSLFPLVISIISAASFFIDSARVKEQIVQGVTYLFSVSSDLITGIVNYVIEARGTTGIIALILLIIGGLAFFDAVRVSLNKVWDVPKPQAFFKGQFLDIVMMFCMALLFVISYLIIVCMRLIIDSGSGLFSGFPVIGLVLLHILIVIVDILLLFVVFLLLYKFIPNLHLRWRDVWLGALLAAVFAEIANVLFTWFLTSFNPYDLVYGPLAAVVALLFWAYLISVIGLLFAKVSAVRLAINRGR